MTTVTGDDLAEIATTIWGTLFELPLERGQLEGVGAVGGSTVTSFVHVSGAWHGAVVLRCPMALAAMLTSAMFQAGGEPGDDDIRDALGELANMVAGNVKALLPEPCGISLPAVAFGVDHEVSVVGTAPIATATFGCAGQPLSVTLLQRPSDAADR